MWYITDEFLKRQAQNVIGASVSTSENIGSNEYIVPQTVDVYMHVGSKT